MQVVYANEPLPSKVTSSIFLMGPTPRSEKVRGWRDDAFRFLMQLGYEGTLLIPEPRMANRWSDYDSQVDWENRALHFADVIVCWLPRKLRTMPAFTTNTEFGEWFKSGKLVFGAPKSAPKTRYQFSKAESEFVPIATTLSKTLQHAVKKIGSGAVRQGGECQVPLYIWNTDSFQNWYRAQKSVGNRLDGAEVVWTFRVGPQKNIVFFWALHVNVYIASEDRHKTNEVVLSRPDISTVVLYKKAENLYDSEVVLVREFRSPASNDTGFVWEVAGGSSFKGVVDPYTLAAEEVHEEVGLTIDPDRVKAHGARQLLATLSAHKAHMFSVEITEEELAWIRSQAGIPKGVIEDTERTYVEIRTVRQILTEKTVDWSMVGMILSVLA